MNKVKKYARGAIIMNSWVVLKKKLTATWGPKEAWPVEWDDVTPSIDIWVDEELAARPFDKFLTVEETLSLADKMHGYVLECVEVLRTEGFVE